MEKEKTYWISEDTGGTHIHTEEEILENYWTLYSSRAKENGLENYTKEDCLQDFVTIHWAYPLSLCSEETLKKLLLSLWAEVKSRRECMLGSSFEFLNEEPELYTDIDGEKDWPE